MGHEQLGISHVSTLDNFFWNETLGDNVVDAGVLHLPDNKSDHSPIYCVIEFQDIQQESPDQPNQKPKPSWKKASQNQKESYKTILENRISQLEVPSSITSCRNVKCNNPAHKEDLDIFTVELLETVQQVAEENLPVPKCGNANSKSEKLIPGWREMVSPFREDAYFWHQLWLSCGRPLNTEVHKIMKKTKNRYHYQYKKCQKAEDKIKRSKLLSSCLNGEGDLFSEIKSLRKSKTVVATSMDGVTENLEDHFRKKYEALYNSANDGEELLRVQAETEAKVDDSSLETVNKITPDIIKQATQKLKPGKSDSVFSFSTDCFKNGTGSLFVNLSLVLQSFLVHGHVSNILLLATLVPIIKDKLGSINVSQNHRSIGISSIL